MEQNKENGGKKIELISTTSLMPDIPHKYLLQPLYKDRYFKTEEKQKEVEDKVIDMFESKSVSPSAITKYLQEEMGISVATSNRIKKELINEYLRRQELPEKEVIVKAHLSDYDKIKEVSMDNGSSKYLEVAIKSLAAQERLLGLTNSEVAIQFNINTNADKDFLDVNIKTQEVTDGE